MKNPTRNERVPVARNQGARLSALVGTFALVALSALSRGSGAQNAPQGPPQGPPQGGASQTWADQQRSQAFATSSLAQSPRHSEWVSIPLGGKTLKAWVVYPQRKGRVPVVLVFHEVFGLTDSTRNTADQIAALGYIAIAPDMVSGLAPDGGNIDAFPTSREASQMMTLMDNHLVNARIDAWADYAHKLHGSNGKLAIVGLSWGGGAAFRYVAMEHRPDLKAVCVFYDVGPPAVTQGASRDKKLMDFPVEKIKVPVYGFYGSRDTRVMNSLQATKNVMAAAHKVYEPVVYEDADHAFLRVGQNPADTNSANPPAVKAAMTRLQNVLQKSFR
jgi:carboxymethylenebutenolidase